MMLKYAEETKGLRTAEDEANYKIRFDSKIAELTEKIIDIENKIKFTYKR